VNLPLTGIMEEGGLLYFISWGIQHEVYPCLIFMGIGAMTDFGPLLANPITFLLGAAAQVGVFVALIGSVLLGFTIQEAGSIGIIGGADGPTAIYLAVKMAPQLLGAIAVAAYSYMSLVPIIQPPIMKLLTTVEERKIVMKQLRPVSRSERILFPIISTVLIGLLLPASVPIIGMLMLGNLFRESMVVNRLSNTAQNELINIVTIFLATSVGATMQAEYFLTFNTIKIILLGLIAFAFGTAGGVLFAKLLNKITGGKINPLIGAAGVSAVPMAARVAQKVGQEANPSNFLLMHAMGPNVAGVIGTAVAAGVMLTLLQ
ncbi:MAG: sodium ion-translocating decarboxylase subunit beta, partial [Candidatus Caldatribacteriota bacterium]|nr:sodium ion-translocating decarboxylase subunit beta [Candidatus Caldatribacteriota bacterium]